MSNKKEYVDLINTKESDISGDSSLIKTMNNEHNVNHKTYDVSNVFNNMDLYNIQSGDIKTGQSLDTFSINAFNYQELQGADFLFYDEEEPILFEVESKENGDVYKILKDSFLNQNSVEIWGYDLSCDKIDLGDLKPKDNISNLNAVLSKNNKDIMLNFADSTNSYSVILKETSDSLSSDKFDDVLQSLILDSFNIKLG